MLRPPYHLHLPFLLLLLSLPPSLAAGGSGAASNVDTVGFWLGFTLLVGLSSLEAAMSIIWTRIRITTMDVFHYCVYSCRVCGREVMLTAIDPEVGRKIVTHWEDAEGCCFPYTGFYTSSTLMGSTSVAVMDLFGNPTLVPTLLIRRFNPLACLDAATGLVDNVRGFFTPGDSTVRLRLEHGVHLIVGLLDVSLGVAGLALNPGSPEELYTALKDPKAPLTFENYSTLFLLYWLLGAVLLICTPTSSERTSVKLIFCFTGGIAFVVASLVSVVLFALGCWKIDVARKAHEDWRPMLSYWIGGSGALSRLTCGEDICILHICNIVLHIFGLVGLVFMLKLAFS